MRTIFPLAILTAALALGGCAGLMRETPLPGEPLAAVRTKLGQPTAVYPDPPGQVLEYATGPMGQYTWMARIGPDGRLVSYEQVLTGEKFATIKVDKATKQDVLRIIGKPAETSYLPLKDYEVWSYRYKEANVWNSMMHVHFDRAGVVRMMQNGPDPMYDDRKRFFFW
jgi:hypothetical protein